MRKWQPISLKMIEKDVEVIERVKEIKFSFSERTLKITTAAGEDFTLRKVNRLQSDEDITLEKEPPAYLGGEKVVFKRSFDCTPESCTMDFYKPVDIEVHMKENEVWIRKRSFLRRW